MIECFTLFPSKTDNFTLVIQFYLHFSRVSWGTYKQLEVEFILSWTFTPLTDVINSETSIVNLSESSRQPQAIHLLNINGISDLELTTLHSQTSIGV